MHGAMLTLLVSSWIASPAKQIEPERHAINLFLGVDPAAQENAQTGEHGSHEPGQSLALHASAHRAWGVVNLSIGKTGLGVGTVTGTLSVTRPFAGDRLCPAQRCAFGIPTLEDGSAIRDLRTITPPGYVLGATGISTWFGLLVATPTRSAVSEHPRVSAWTPIVGLGSAGARYAF
jgi:hypothetical protein